MVTGAAPVALGHSQLVPMQEPWDVFVRVDHDQNRTNHTLGWSSYMSSADMLCPLQKFDANMNGARAECSSLSTIMHFEKFIVAILFLRVQKSSKREKQFGATREENKTDIFY